MTSDQVIWGGGTAALIAILVVIGRELWAAHKASDEDVKKERDEWKAIVRTVVEPIATIAETQKTQNRILERMAGRHREYDGAGDRSAPDKR